MPSTGDRPWRPLLLLAGATAALVAAFTTLPAAISGAVHGSRDLTDVRSDLDRGLVGLWRSGGSSFPPTLRDVVDYWMVWHATKIVICVAGMVVLTLLARDLWTRRLGGSRVTAAAAVTATIPAVALVLAANVQSTTASSIALLPLLPEDPDGALGSTLAAMSASLGAGAPRPAPTQALVDDVATYQWSMAVVAIVLLAVAVTTAARSWRRLAVAAPGTPARGMHAALLAIAIVSAIAFILLLANATWAATHPASALLDLLGH